MNFWSCVAIVFPKAAKAVFLSHIVFQSHDASPIKKGSPTLPLDYGLDLVAYF